MVKKWLKAFATTFSLTFIFIMLFNFIIDPYGAFGDEILKMYNYDQEQNIRITKISYLDKHYEDFDSYIIGGSKSGAYIPSNVEKYFPGSNFYNMNMIGGRFYDYEKTIQYIVNNYKVKNIVLQISQIESGIAETARTAGGMLNINVSGEHPVTYYSKILMSNPTVSFEKLTQYIQGEKTPSFYNIIDGAYNFSTVENRIKKDSKKYFSDKKLFPDANEVIKDTVYDSNLEYMRRIVALCKEKNVNLMVICAPTYKVEVDAYNKDDLMEFMLELAEITDYWNFTGYNSVNIEKTNFYNNNHFRVNVAKMVMARIFNDKSIKVPSDFGAFVTDDNAAEIVTNALHK